MSSGKRLGIFLETTVDTEQGNAAGSKEKLHFAAKYMTGGDGNVALQYQERIGRKFFKFEINLATEKN